MMGKLDFNEKQRLCMLCFDEMKIKSTYEYDKSNDSILSTANYVQVVMARGLLHKWKQPVFYSYDCPMTKKILFQIIESLSSANYTTVGIVSDMGTQNQALWSNRFCSGRQIHQLSTNCESRKFDQFNRFEHNAQNNKCAFGAHERRKAESEVCSPTILTSSLQCSYSMCRIGSNQQ